MFPIFILVGMASVAYNFYLTLKVFNILERKRDGLNTLFILSGWWPLNKEIVSEKHENLIHHGRVTLIIMAVSFGIAINMAITSNEI